MAGFIQNILWNSVSGFVEAGTRTAGGFAGDALIKAGDLVENGGRNVGTGIERKFSNYGSALTGQAPQKPSAKALPSTARKPVIKRSNSTPASNKPTTGGVKYPGTSGAKPAAKKPTPSYPTGATNSTVARAKSTAGGATGKTLPKPYTPGGNLSFPEAKKTAVRAGQSKPFNAAAAGKPANAAVGKAGGNNGAAKAYPGTSTLPGQGGTKAVRATPYKSVPRMAPPAQSGKATFV